MIVRTYKRRSRAEVLGLQGSSIGDSSSVSLYGGSQDDDEPGSYLWSSSSQEDHLSFSQPFSSQGSSLGEDDTLRTFSLPTESDMPQFHGTKSETSIRKGNCGRILTAGQKLIKAEGLLKKTKTNSYRGHSKAHDTEHGRELGGSALFNKDNANCATGNGLPAPIFVPRDGPEPAEGTNLSGDESMPMAISVTYTGVIGPSAPPTSTLLEAQESGEMMEHVDEANFALDGLRPGQPLRICRASLSSLLSIFSSKQRRRLLRTHGMIKPVLDAVLTISTEDAATALAAAALLYVVAQDGHDEDFLDSPLCIRFVLKLLNLACPSPAHKDKKLSLLGSRLLALGSHPKANKAEAHLPVELDQGGLLLVDKVKHLVSTMKECSDGFLQHDDQSASFTAEVLSSEWLVLLTLEKACLSTVVLEDNAGSVRRVGGNFKERLRELGGLNAVCELAASCFLNLRRAFNIKSRPDILQQNTLLKGSRGVGVLLQCLKVMENATFLSKKNQEHLLNMVLSSDSAESPNTFVGVVIETISTVSDIILSRAGFHPASHGKQIGNSMDIPSSKPVKGPSQGGRNGVGSEGNAKGALLGLSCKETTVKGSFDFDEQELIREKGCLINHVHKKQKSQMLSKTQAHNMRPSQSAPVDTIAASKGTQDKLLEDCLLSGVKVLMNLTNDNEFGCQQVAKVGGLEALALLLAKHFSSIRSSPCTVLNGEASGGLRKESSAARQEDEYLDLLVVVLGVLVNLVEKDNRNRSRLVSLDTEGFPGASNGIVARNPERSIIKLLCSIFLSKEGAGRTVEAAGADTAAAVDAESSFKQGLQEAEDMILEAYSALLLAFLSRESLIVRSTIARFLPEGKISILVPVLERFLAFHVSLNMLSSETHSTVKEVIESCR